MSFWKIHGLDPGPLQRPLLAGGITGGLASLPAAALVWGSGAVLPPSRALGLPPKALVFLSIVGLVVAGTAYGAVLRRAASDPRGGWLFGLGWGGLTWMLGPITACKWLLGRPISSGKAAAVLLAGHLLWGLLLGVACPWVQRRVQMDIDKAPPPRRYRAGWTGHARSRTEQREPGPVALDATSLDQRAAGKGRSHG